MIMDKNEKILIYGAGVIGSIYAVKLSNAGYGVTVYDRSNRLHTLKTNGLFYQDNDSVKKAPVKIIEKLNSTDIYDYIFVTVRYEQIETALAELKNNNSCNIVTVVNTPDGYSLWEDIIGSGKIIPAFPGAGGRIEDGILYYQLTPKIVQPTTFGELNGEMTERIKILEEIFKTSKIPCSISKNMEAWQKSHLAMVIPFANSIYYDGGNNYTTAKNKEAIHMMSSALKKNFNILREKGVPITPLKLQIFRICPLWIMNIALSIIYNTKFAEDLISSHANNAKEEMQLLNRDFTEMISR